MNVYNKYFDIIINDNSFYVVECSSKPKNEDSALATLAKIETVVKNNFEYHFDHKDEYSKLSKSDLLKILKKKAYDVRNGYTKKQSKLNWLARKVFSKEKKVKAIHTRIENYISPPQLLPLPNEIIQKMSKYLKAPDIATVAQLNRHGNAHAASAFVRRAGEFEYEGRDKAEANDYIKNIFKEVKELAKQKIIPEKYIAYKKKSIFKKKIDSEKTLTNLKAIDIKDFFTLLSNTDIYSNDFKTFYLFLLKPLNAYLNTAPGKLTEIDVRNAAGDTALMLATKAGKKEVVQILLEHGADASIVSGTGQHSPPIHHAAFHGHTDIIELLLQHGANANFRNAAGYTALMLATKTGKKEVVQLLLEHGVDANFRNAAGDTALMLATKAGKKEVVQILLEHGADASIVSGTGNHSPPIHHAAFHGHTDITELLLQHGADVNFRNTGGDTALMLATKTGKKEVVQLLLEHGADASIVSGTGNHSPPIHHAAFHGHTDIIELLLQHGADANFRDTAGYTALMLATKTGKKKVVQLLSLNGGI